MLGLGTVFYFALLLINSIAILNEERFLSRGASLLTVGWSPNSVAIDQGFAGGDPGVKTRLVQLISAVRVLLRSACVLTVPLIVVNTIVIVYELAVLLFAAVLCAFHASCPFGVPATVGV